MFRQGSRRPSAPEIERAALALIARHGADILATARRYSTTVDDAEDAYQRGLEILLRKAPTTAHDELLPWLKTVIKHEAFAVRRQRERAAPVTLDAEPPDEPAAEAEAHTQAERYERLRLGAEALGRLKPQEMRALRLKAEGFSYREIQAITGWSYTKVNRAITEGRRAFLANVAGIEAGSECERLGPQLSALADGEASAEDLGALRPHLRSCLSCRARLREFRAAPARVAALLPPLALGAAHGGGTLRAWLESLAGAAQHKASVAGDRIHTAAELATGQKVAAVAASAAALAGGGATIDKLKQPPARSPVDQRQAAQPVERKQAVQRVKQEPAGPAPAPVAQAAPATKPGAPPPDPANEFAPGAVAPVAPARAAPAGAPSQRGGGGSEFGP